MPELKNWDRSLYPPTPPDLDWDTYAYKDKQHEKQRRQALAEYLDAKSNGQDATPTSSSTYKKRTSTTAWSEKVDHKASKEVKRTKREAKRAFERKAKMSEEDRAREAETADMVEEIRRLQKEKMKNDMDRDGGVFEGFA
jgi:ATP-dependent RNA helicase DDX55/SPB4